MGEHRVPVLNAGVRRYIDPERSPDPRIRALVADLRVLNPAPAPRAHFRAELRAQLVAVAPRLVAEGVAIETAGATAERPAVVERPARAAHAASGSSARGLLGRLSTMSIAKPVAVLVAAVAIVAMALSTAVWMSKKALPGDTLYALKRANENVQLSLTSGSTDRGKTLLSFASRRADEVQDLLARASALAAGSGANAAGGINARTARLITSTLDSADDDVRHAARLFGSEAVKTRSASPLAAMTGWAPDQATRLQDIVDRIPAGALHDRAASSQSLVVAAMTRSMELSGLLGCVCLDGAPSDDLGPIPCNVCQLLPTPPSQSPSGTPTTSISAPGTETPSTDTPSTDEPTSPTPSDPTTNGGGLPTVSLPPVTLPTLPSGLPTPPTLFPTDRPSCLIVLLGICVPKGG